MLESPASRGAPDLPSDMTIEDACDLREAVLEHAVHCDGEACVYWRALYHVGIDSPEEQGCALRHFEVSFGERPELAHWLLSVKRRVEAEVEGAPAPDE